MLRVGGDALIVEIDELGGKLLLQRSSGLVRGIALAVLAEAKEGEGNRTG